MLRSLLPTITSRDIEDLRRNLILRLSGVVHVRAHGDAKNVTVPNTDSIRDISLTVASHPSFHSSATSTRMWGTRSSRTCNNSSGSSLCVEREAEGRGLWSRPPRYGTRDTISRWLKTPRTVSSVSYINGVSHESSACDPRIGRLCSFIRFAKKGFGR